MSLRKAELVQQCQYLSEEQIKKALDRKCITKWAYICHDKDQYTKSDEEKNRQYKAGTLKAPHWHIVMQFSVGQQIENIAKWFEQKPERVEKSKSGRFEHMLTYLVHANDSTKFQYRPEEVKSNFDYIAFIQSGASSTRQVEIVQQIRDGIIREYNYTDYMTVFEYNKYKKSIDNAYKYRRDSIYTGNRQLDVIYVCGTSGSGKTSYAKWLCEQKKYSYFVTGSGDDILDGYKGQDCIILDDIRSSTMKFSDFIKMIDNNTDSSVKSRYYNKSLTECKLLIITTIYELDKFYSMFKEQDEPLLQFKRRCKLMLKINEYRVEVYQFNRYTSNYDYETEYVNPVQDLILKSIEEKRSVQQLDEFLCMKPIQHITTLNLKRPKDELPFS